MWRRWLPDELNVNKIPLGALLLFAALFYLAFHALNGERGLYAYLKQSRNLEVTKAELGALQAQRKDLETRVRLLREESLDLDMLDEQARHILGTAKGNEIVLFVEPEAKP